MLSLERPTLLLDKTKCLANIERISAKARKSKVTFRPHFKTHQSHEIGRWFRDFDITKCTVSSLQMAKYFVEDGWDDITVAFPLNYLEHKIINKLASKVKLNLCVSMPGVLPKLDSLINNKIQILIEVDTGYHRTGIEAAEHKVLESLIEEIESSKNCSFVGFLSHAGHTYKARGQEAIKAIHDEEVSQLMSLKERFSSRFPHLMLSIGDTPSASVCQDFDGIDEVRAGNMIFYDLTQNQIGSCDLEDIAIALACPVVATYPNRNEVIVYGGGVHFSKDTLLNDQGLSIYGRVVRLNENGWELPPTGMYVKSLSQEHGIIAASDSEITSIEPGDTLGILPVHSCLMAEAMGNYVTLGGQHITRLRTC